MHGFLNINKPAGVTSHDVVYQVRKRLGTKRVGHGGTLDPDATGVLVVAVGQTTRLLPYLPLEPKKYTARLCLGATTSTEDASGTVLETHDASHLTEAQLRVVLPRFVGQIQQIPPMVSAVHHEGRRLYELAREGKTVERTPRAVVIHDLQMRDFCPGAQPEVTLEIVCGGGTYVRTLCADIGAELGVGGFMKSLVRTAVGAFELADALALENTSASCCADALLPAERVLPFPCCGISAAERERIVQGQSIEADTAHEEGAIVSLLFAGRLCALARRDGVLLSPFRVFPTES